MHFEQQLHQLRMLSGNGGFEVLNVRHHGVDFQIETDTAPLLCSSCTDAVLVPYGELSWELQLHVVIDWKKPDSLQSLQGGKLQQTLELMGALFHSNHPALMVFTDLINFAIYQPYTNAVQYSHTFASPASGRVSASDAMRLIANQLCIVSCNNPRFSYQHLASIPQHGQLQQQGTLLLKAKNLSGAEEGLLEQLSIVKDLPAEEQV